MSEPNYMSGETVEQFISMREAWLADAVELMTGDREADPLQVFPVPTEVRADAPELDISDEQEQDLRDIAGRFGIGGEVDVPAAAEVEILEPGKPWKVEAEAVIATGIKVYIGLPARRIDDGERAYVQHKLPAGEAAAVTEYEMVRQMAELDHDFVPLDEDVVLSFGYEARPGFAVNANRDGQLLQIGTSKGQPVFLLRLDSYTENENGKLRNIKPKNAELMAMVGLALERNGVIDARSIGLLTSSTYPSRLLDTMIAGLRSNLDFRLGMYGRNTLAAVKNEPIAGPPDLNQIPGELHTYARKLKQLKAVLAES